MITPESEASSMVVYGTAAADCVYKIPHFPASGEMLSATSEEWRLGGGSANVACALTAAGHEVQFVGAFGNDERGTELLAQLGQHGVDTTKSFRVGAATPHALILLEPNGERTIVVADAAFNTKVYPLALSDLPPIIDSGGVYIETYDRFPTALGDQLSDALVMVNSPSPGAERWPADVIIGSEGQFANEWRGGPFRAAQSLAGSRLQWFIVTRGRQGADAFGPRGAFVHVDAQPAKQVDTTGAGDTFAAMVLAGLLEGDNISQAMTRGAEASAAAVGLFQSVGTAAIGRPLRQPS